MEIVKKMAHGFETDRITLKIIEEMAELNEVLIKSVTKAEGYKPPPEKIVEEAGDLLFRLDVLIEKLGIKEAVSTRYSEKAKQLEVWYREKYETNKHLNP